MTHGPNFDMADTLQPQIHIWGHAHGAHGVRRKGEKTWGYECNCTSINASIMNTKYEPHNQPIVVDFQMDK